MQRPNFNVNRKKLQLHVLSSIFRTEFPAAYERTSERKIMEGCRNYQIGVEFEYRVQHYLKGFGWTVARVAKSAGCFDLIAVRGRTEQMFIECRRGGFISANQTAKLSEIAGDRGLPVLATRASPYKIELKNLFNNQLIFPAPLKFDDVAVASTGQIQKYFQK